MHLVEISFKYENSSRKIKKEMGTSNISKLGLTNDKIFIHTVENLETVKFWKWNLINCTIK